MALSKRLLALYRLAQGGRIGADIGCDHGLLAITLAQHGYEHVYACDLRAQPLAAARSAVKQAKLQERITCIQCDGLAALDDSVDTIIIAGMGFDTIRTILMAEPQKLCKGRRFIVQSNSHVEQLRQWISDHHFTIMAEDLIKEDHFYELLCFTCETHSAYDAWTQRYGVFLPHHPLFKEYCIHRLKRVEVILEHLPKEHAKYSYYLQFAQELHEFIGEEAPSQ
ncbi:MAG: SAM-dependent methyltransferase [Erysipelotrichaceae bacterium]|nr:SAM-dependent methyltransferase [Erysipelotrichaceae bacterium]